MGASQFDAVAQLTGSSLSGVERLRRLAEFAHALGWRPSDRLEIPGADGAQAHLLVEHGLQNTAVISFVQRPARFEDLSEETRRRLFSISYNNLVDWHIPIEADTVSFVFVRTRVPTVVERERFSRDNYDILRSETFERVSGKRPNPNIPALDDALIRTVSLWKRHVAAELGAAATIESIAALFNALIFVRALEDTHSSAANDGREQLRTMWNTKQATGGRLRDAIRATAIALVGSPPPAYLLDESHLAVFDNLSSDTVANIIGDFYQNRFAPYRYDFSMMSKHALSRIYEHYVSVLHEPTDSYQLQLIPSAPASLPEESINRSTGTVYTPQFIARFFARYLREQIPPFVAKRMKYVDPACGSGIFLRTMLELLCDPLQQDMSSPELVEHLFSNASGIDNNENAVQATRLSLALLYLAIQGHLPESINATCADALRHFYRTRELLGTFDAVLANPPFVSHDHQSLETRASVADVLGRDAIGRSDLHLAFIKLSIDLLKPGGCALFVLPHSFLLAENASAVRAFLARECWIRCLADLSAIQVFEGLGIYVILLIVEKRSRQTQTPPLATIVKCLDLVGHALQDAVDNRFVETPNYSVYGVPQSEFSSDSWAILAPAEALAKQRLEKLPPLRDFLKVSEGVVTGKDDVFIRPLREVPREEREVWMPLLQDREMSAYGVPAQVPKGVFIPYLDGTKLDESSLKKRFPDTWKYLMNHRSALEVRKSIIKYRRAWWEPMWPRPDAIRRPKIVAPHLVVVPRYSVDVKGRYAVTRGPIMTARDESDEVELLKFFAAIMNSSLCFWYVSAHAHRYQRGYVMLEPKTLANTPVPDPAKIPARVRRDLVRLVDDRLLAKKDDQVRLEREIDVLVADLYGLPRRDLERLGLGF